MGIAISTMDVINSTMVTTMDVIMCTIEHLEENPSVLHQSGEDKDDASNHPSLHSCQAFSLEKVQTKIPWWYWGPTNVRTYRQGFSGMWIWPKQFCQWMTSPSLVSTWPIIPASWWWCSVCKCLTLMVFCRKVGQIGWEMLCYWQNFLQLVRQCKPHIVYTVSPLFAWKLDQALHSLIGDFFCSKTIHVFRFEKH